MNYGRIGAWWACAYCGAVRSGIWARRDITPWGSGRPFSRSQLRHLLRDAGSLH